MSFFVSKELEGKVSLENLEKKSYKQIYNVKEIKVKGGCVYLCIDTKKIKLEQTYLIDELYIKERVYKFKQKIKFNLESIKILDNKFDLVIFIDEHLFWKELNHE